MYKRKIKEDLDCGLHVAMKVFGAKWKPCIIDAIARGAKRPSEIHKQITSTSPRVLDMQLRELLEFGVVMRKNQSGYPLHVEYTLTSFGEGMLPILAQMAKWGETHKEFIKQQTMLIEQNVQTDTARPIAANDVLDARNFEMTSVCQSA
jgi:DNA-binding HxlR family transcriptional regulator